jgi:hypothetical protein
MRTFILAVFLASLTEPPTKKHTFSRTLANSKKTKCVYHYLTALVMCNETWKHLLMLQPFEVACLQQQYVSTLEFVEAAATFMQLPNQPLLTLHKQQQQTINQ